MLNEHEKSSDDSERDVQENGNVMSSGQEKITSDDSEGDGRENGKLTGSDDSERENRESVAAISVRVKKPFRLKKVNATGK